MWLKTSKGSQWMGAGRICYKSPRFADRNENLSNYTTFRQIHLDWRYLKIKENYCKFKDRPDIWNWKNAILKISHWIKCSTYNNTVYTLYITCKHIVYCIWIWTRPHALLSYACQKGFLGFLFIVHIHYGNEYYFIHRNYWTVLQWIIVLFITFPLRIYSIFVFFQQSKENNLRRKPRNTFL